MYQYVLRRLVAALPTLVGVLVVVFFVVHLIPGDPIAAMLGDTATAEQLERTRRQYGFDRPLHEQFLIFLNNYATGEMGTSIRTRRPVIVEITSRFPHTLQLALGGALIAVLLGVPLGVVSAVRRGSLVDLTSLVVSTAGVAAPIFWIGLLLSLLFATYLGWFPSIGAGRPGDPVSVLRALVLPSLSLGLAGMALIARMTRSSVLEVLQEDYVRTAKAKGLKQQLVVYKHALKNAANPIITIVGLNFGYLLGGTVLIETVYARPGLGKLLVDAILARDYPVVQGVTFVIAASFILVNLVTDLVYSLVDPRVLVS
jgi:peptide/nickel transport system permease protein